MSTSSARTFFLTIALAVSLLILAGSMLYLPVPYKNLVILVTGTVGVSILLIKHWSNHRESVQLIISLRQLTEGKLNKSSDKNSKRPEIALVNLLLLQLDEAAHFIETLEEATTTSELQFLRPEERLGKALLDMKSTLRTYREDEATRHWSAQGLAYFADLLRGHSDNIQAFGDHVMRHLVRYLEVNQGGAVRENGS